MFECRAVLFDLDGVLVDSTGSVGRVWKLWAEQHGLDPEAVVHTAHGRRSIETIRLTAPHLDAEATNKIVERMEIEDTRDLTVIEGAHKTLASLPDGTWAVVTSGTRDLATSRIKAAGLTFPVVLISANEVTQGKPSPEPYLKGAEMLGVAPAECLVFEDTPSGIESAHNAGISVIALKTTYPLVALAAADAIVESFSEIAIRPSVRAGWLEISVMTKSTETKLPSGESTR